MCEALQSIKEQLTSIENDVTQDSKICDIFEIPKPSLMDMPVEILIQICSFLDVQILKHTLSKVCQRFYDILADDCLWKYWVHSKVNGTYPALPDLKLWEETAIDWEAVCIEMDLETKKWTKVKDTMRHIVVKDVHFASVDTVLLVNISQCTHNYCNNKYQEITSKFRKANQHPNVREPELTITTSMTFLDKMAPVCCIQQSPENGEVCISGGRDRGMALWNVLDIDPHDESDNLTSSANAKPKHIKHDAHAGWIWDLAADNIDSASSIYSASWDNTVKAWDLATGLECKQTFQCGMTALSVVTIENEVITGLYSKKILSFDVRAGPTHVYAYKPHKGPVLALQTFNNMVASLSEDKTMAIWDRTAGKLLLSDIKIPTDKAYPVCISWSPTALYIGDSKGFLHLFNPENHSYVRTHEIWPEPPIIKPPSKITGCYQNQGNMIVCSDRGEIKFLYNSYPLQEFMTVKSSTLDLTQLRYLNGVLVVGTCDSALEFWVPQEKYQNL